MAAATETVTRYQPSLVKQRMPKGLPKSWYEDQARRLKAMRLAIALIETGTYDDTDATDEVIAATAKVIGVREPSERSCRLVRDLLRVTR